MIPKVPNELKLSTMKVKLPPAGTDTETSISTVGQRKSETGTDNVTVSPSVPPMPATVTLKYIVDPPGDVSIVRVTLPGDSTLSMIIGAEGIPKDYVMEMEIRK